MRNRYILLADVPLIAIAAFGAFVLRFDLLSYTRRAEFVPFVVAALLLKPVVFYLLSMYGRYWRYASIQDLLVIMLAVSAASIGMFALVLLGLVAGVLPEFSRAVVVIDGLLTLLLAGGVRLSVRVLGEARDRPRESGPGRRQRRILVVGAGEAGAMVIREMKRNPQLGMEPIGFLDDDRTKVGKLIQGVPVLGDLSSIDRHVRSHAADEIVIAMPTAPGTVVRAVAETCQRLGVAFRTMPGVFELLDGNVSVSRLRNVDIADLLRRNPVAGRADPSSYVRNRVVLVTGAGGSIGLELCRQVAYHQPAALIMVGHGENSIFEAVYGLRELYPEAMLVPVIADIREQERMRQVFARHRPDVVFHAAAHKHVPLMEENPEEAITNNVIGTSNMVDAAAEAGVARFVLISTDKAVSPSSVMGASKRIAEAVVRGAAWRTGGAFVVVRFGNVLGSRGSVVPFFKRQIERGGPVTVTHPEMRRFFMTVPEAVHLVLQAGGMGRGGELFVLKMEEPIRIVSLAEDLIKLSGFTLEQIPIVFTGIRAGEKLEETLWEHDGIAEPTTHPEVLRVIEREIWHTNDLPGIVSTLAVAAQCGDCDAIHEVLARVIPTFVAVG